VSYGRILAAGIAISTAVGALAAVGAFRSRSAEASPNPAPAPVPVPVPAPAAAPATATATAAARDALPPEVRARLSETPDLLQTDPEMALPAGGESHCAPVAASNALMWLVARGFDRLAPAGATPRERQIGLVRLLGSHRFMGTDGENGTGTRGVLKGLHRYLEQTGHAYKRLRYQGWRAHDYRFTSRGKTPELSFITEGLAPRSIVIANVGWYRPAQDRPLYVRHGGHWLTVVGAGFDARGNSAPNVLVLHDPAPYAGKDFENVYAELVPLDGGWLFEQRAALPARGYYQMAGGMYVKREGEIAILDGVVVLEL
jgi:hypothetical protein